MEADMKKLQDTADLFEVSFPEYKQLRQCRSDIRLVKAVWDMVVFVRVRISYFCVFIACSHCLSHLEHFCYIVIKEPRLLCAVCFSPVTVKYRGLDQDSVEGDQR